jgi:SAM-dependent methyltransferase
MIRLLDRVVPEAPGRPDAAGPDHPMRAVTRQVAFEPDGWTPQRAAKVAELFDGLADEWHTRGSPHRRQPLDDALARGGQLGADVWVEVGSGTGLLTPVLAALCRSLVAVDISAEMLRRAPAGTASRVQADAARLPVKDGCVDALVLINAFLFPLEAARVLSAGGAVVWVNTSGDRTPIYLGADDVNRALGPDWDGVAAEAGWGTWAVLRRTYGRVATPA